MTTIPAVTPEIAKVLVRDGDLVETIPADDDTLTAAVERSSLPELAESALHLLHLDEVMLIPVGNWGGVIDLVAFDLATDETWLSIDAEASLHQTRRDPLVLGAGELGLVSAMTEALLKNGDSEEVNLTVAATGAPFLLEIVCAGALRAWCAHERVRDHLLGR